MALLKNRNYLLLRTGWSVSGLGSQMQSFAFSLSVLAVTGSAVKFSVTLCMQVLPMILFAPLCGYVSDRFDRKRQVILYDLLSAAAVFAFYFLDRANGKLEIYQIYACVFLLSSFQNFLNSSAMCLLQASVDPADYTKQKSADTTLSNLVSVFAPALAGVLYGLGGIRTVMLINGLSFLLSAAAESRLSIAKRTETEEGEPPLSFAASVREGLGYIRASAFIRSFLVVLSVLNFILPAAEIGVTVVAQQGMGLNAAAVGAVNSVLSAGVLAGAVFCGVRSRQMEKLNLDLLIRSDVLGVAAAFSLIGVWLLLLRAALPLPANLAVFVALNLIIMVADSILSVNLSARFQRAVPNEIMGRVGASVNAVLTVCVPLGQVAAGLLMGELPYWAAYFAEGAVSLLLFALCFKNARKPAIMETETPEENPGAPESGEAAEKAETGPAAEGGESGGAASEDAAGGEERAV